MHSAIAVPKVPALVHCGIAICGLLVRARGAPVQNVDVAILGTGAAGLMCAIETGRRGRRVLLLDHAEAIGKKILISGGGRSNFTNLHCTPANFLSENPHFAKSALARYTPSDFIALVEKHRIPYHEKPLGQLFCDRSSRDIVEMLARECSEAGVRIQLSTSISRVTREADRFLMETSIGPMSAASVVVATGGLSIPKMGATGFGYELARQFGLNIIEPRPALVPFTFSPADRDVWCDLSGVSAEVVASIGNSKRADFREKITHHPSRRQRSRRPANLFLLEARRDGRLRHSARSRTLRSAASAACSSRRRRSPGSAPSTSASPLGGTLAPDASATCDPPAVERDPRRPRVVASRLADHPRRNRGLRQG